MANKKKKTTTKKVSGAHREQLKQNILQFINNNPRGGYSIKLITKKLSIRDKKSKDLVPEILFELERQGHVNRLRNGSFKSARKEKTASEVTGIVDHVNPKFAYIVSPDSEEDIWVKTEFLKYAFDGDTVRVKVFHGRKGRRPEGKVQEVLKRKHVEIVGLVELSERFAFIVPDSRKIYEDIFVPLNKTQGANHNDKVIVKVVEWPDDSNSPVGEVVRVLGPAGDNEAEIHSIMAEFGLPMEFDDKVIEESEAIPDAITAEEYKKRRDMRKTTTFTIDPHDAKDFDDAISFAELPNGNLEIGVHIADVTHYIRPGTLLEREAQSRATSVYLVDRTVPMLPERLSNGLCSLRPKEEKLTFSAIFEIDREAQVVKEWFGRTVTYSDRRFTYEEAQEILEGLDGEFSEELRELNRLAKILKTQRFQRGAINFETVEVKFKLDEKGKPLGIIPKVRKDAHKLVEEFMLLANRKVAAYVANQNKGKNTFVYRTHDNPDPEKLNAFAVFARKFGYDLKFEEGKLSKELNGLMENIEGKPEQNVLEQLAIRSMAKAKYTTTGTSHFGLAFQHYTHFTSPIRRYPDMMVHRLLQHYLDKGKPASQEEYEDKCVHSSDMEKRAAEAERASIKYKQVEYMQSVEDKIFEGIVTGVTEWGIFVEMTETKCEGMIRLADLNDDYYVFDEENYRVIGERNKKMYTLGDQVHVRVKDTNINRRTIDLEFAKNE